jgi:hypothetical protein
VGKTVVDNSVKIEQHNHHVEVNINVFGSEKTDTGRIRAIVRAETARLGGSGAEDRLTRNVLMAVARAIWLERPENRTAFIPNVKANRARVRVAEGWEDKSGTAVAEAMPPPAKDETSRKQPMETMADVALMDPVLRALDEEGAPIGELRALLVRPEA